MTLFTYKNGTLIADQVPVADIAADVGTPFYLYVERAFLDNYTAYATAMAPLGAHVFYAMKANSNQAVLTSLARAGAGADTVSGGEISRALAAGFSPNRIIFSGVGKTDEELGLALDQAIYQINIETPGEMMRLNRLALERGVKANVAFRVNFNIGAGGHEKITTGKSDNKFGIDAAMIPELVETARRLEGLSVKGLASHIGSQITTLQPFSKSGEKVRALFLALNQQGFQLERLDLGGGLGVTYTADETPATIGELGRLYLDLFGDLKADIAIEPGRSIIADSGLLVTKVIETQSRENKAFIIVDAAMNDLIRPTLYGAHHPVITVNEPASDIKNQALPVDIVGPVCETGDFLAENIRLPAVRSGDLLALTMAGAYGAVMSSGYNSRQLVPEVLVNGDKVALVRPRPTIQHMMIDADVIPDWLRL